MTQRLQNKVVIITGGGSIINVSSVAQYAAQEHAAPYCASKAGLDGLTKTAAIELAPHRIRVNNVAPGDIDTEASHDVVERAAERGAAGRFFRFTPLDRRGTPEEIGRVVTFLASDEASFVTGATWLVDGGFLSY
jgi:NAD(P)-dependent dehydrogenase (short-subunit alcohol dehydrogenase family)